MVRSCLAIASIVFASAAPASAQAIQALGLFEQRCGTCHTKPAADSRAPDRDSLRQHFEVNAEHVVVAALSLLVKRGHLDKQVVQQAIEEFKIDPDVGDPRYA